MRPADKTGGLGVRLERPNRKGNTVNADSWAYTSLQVVPVGLQQRKKAWYLEIMILRCRSQAKAVEARFASMKREPPLPVP